MKSQIISTFNEDLVTVKKHSHEIITLYNKIIKTIDPKIFREIKDGVDDVTIKSKHIEKLNEFLSINDTRSSRYLELKRYFNSNYDQNVFTFTDKTDMRKLRKFKKQLWLGIFKNVRRLEIYPDEKTMKEIKSIKLILKYRYKDAWYLIDQYNDTLIDLRSDFSESEETSYHLQPYQPKKGYDEILSHIASDFIETKYGMLLNKKLNQMQKFHGNDIYRIYCDAVMNMCIKHDQFAVYKLQAIYGLKMYKDSDFTIENLEKVKSVINGFEKMNHLRDYDKQAINLINDDINVLKQMK